MLWHMRTTLRVDPTLYRRAKAQAARNGTTVTALFEDALRSLLDRPTVVTLRNRGRLPTSGRGGLRPGVNLDSSAELLDLMDGLDASR